MAFRHILQISGTRRELENGADGGIKDRQIAIQNDEGNNVNEKSLVFKTQGQYMVTVTNGNSANLKSLTIGPALDKCYKLPVQAGDSGNILTMKENGVTAWEKPVQSLWNVDQNDTVYLTDNNLVVGGSNAQGRMSVYGTLCVEAADAESLIILKSATDKKNWSITNQNSTLIFKHDDLGSDVAKLSATGDLQVNGMIKSLTNMETPGLTVSGGISCNNINVSNTLTVSSSATVTSLNIGSGETTHQLNINNGSAYIGNKKGNNLIEFKNTENQKSWYFKLDQYGDLELASKLAPSNNILFTETSIVSKASIVAYNGITVNDSNIYANGDINCGKNYNSSGKVNCIGVNTSNVNLSKKEINYEAFEGAIVFENKTTMPTSIPADIRNALFSVNGELYWVNNSGQISKVQTQLVNT